MTCPGCNAEIGSKAICSSCWHRLPDDIRRNLWALFGEEFTAEMKKAEEWLRAKRVGA